MTDNIKERPILFSGAMVRALLDGRKTQTRRVFKQAVGPSLSVDCDERGVAELSWLHGDGPGHEVHERIQRVPCPYGAPRDRLYVREAFIHEPADYCWEASVSIPCRPASTVYRADSDPDGAAKGAGWSPSIHMPRGLSRITLEITGVRVERLQVISEADAIAEGVHAGSWEYDNGEGTETACESFQCLWDSLAARGTDWETNPYVWVVEFKRVKG
jgi:hypothetical protein